MNDINAYVISLTERTDRRKRMEVSLKNRNIDFSYFNGIKLDKSVRDYKGHKFPIGDRFGSPGCYVSHIELLELCRDKKMEYALIMEDDVYPMNIDCLQYLKNTIAWVKENPWADMIYFEYILFEPSKISRYNHFLHKVTGGTWGTGCYLVTAGGIDKALRASVRIKSSLSAIKHIDIFYTQRVHALGNSFLHYPKLCFQSDSKSSILGHSNFFDKYLDARKTCNFRYI